MHKKEFQRRLKNWYRQHKRDLPWRETSDPYSIWLSEIILQQTRVNQGLPYYLKFIERYPDVHTLAKAEEDEVMRDWEGLGYYSRARNMQAAARFVSEELKGVFPATYNDILKLKGVGAYTAAAISSFAFNEPQAVLDGNVYRVLSRYLNVEIPVSKGKKEYSRMAGEMLDRDDPALYNQAIMEFGALQCVPKKPACGSCIFNDHCQAYILNKVDELPVKDKKSYDRPRFFNYLLIELYDEVLVERRQGKDIWHSLFQFPLIETSEPVELPALLETDALNGIITGDFVVEESIQLSAHKLSHQTVYCNIVRLKVRDRCEVNRGVTGIWVNREKLNDMAFPRPLRQFLDRNQLTLSFAR